MNKSAKDQLGRTILVPSFPRKIISLVPSITELLFDLGLEEEISGRTKFCIHPKELMQSVPKIGGTKNVNINKVHQLYPDIIIANKEENTKEQVETLEKKYPIWISDVQNFQDAIDLIISIGEVFDKDQEAMLIKKKILSEKELFNKEGFEKLNVIYLIWRRPYMAAGKDSFINSMLEAAGFNNLIQANRYPEVSIENIIKLNPDLILLSSEPYPFGDKHILELQKLVKSIPIALVDGEFFSWYGSRMKGAFQYFSKLRKKLK